MLIAFNKPYGVLTQFTDQSRPPRPTLAGFGLPQDVYAAGRLDIDSEGLLLLSDDGARIAQISSPKFKWPKTYLVQVEGVADETHLAQLRACVVVDLSELKAGGALFLQQMMLRRGLQDAEHKKPKKH